MHGGWPRRAGARPKSCAASPARPAAAPRPIRYTLKQFDQEHPDLAIFPDNHGPLRPETKRKIYQQYHRGESVESLAKRFCRTRASIYRIIAEMRAEQICRIAAGLHPQRRVRQGAAGAQARERRSSGRCRPIDEPLKKAAAAQPACRPIWPACTRCRC